jgi:hypothetical protein
VKLILLVVPALLVVACQADTAVNAAAECASDATCALGAWTADCCPRCKPFAGTSSEAAAMDNQCRAMSPVSGRCPELKCPPHEGPDYFAKCVSGRCVVGP